MQYPFPKTRQKAAHFISRTRIGRRYEQLYAENSKFKAAADAGGLWACAQANNLITDSLVIGALCNGGLALRSAYASQALLNHGMNATSLVQRGFELASFAVCAGATAGALFGFALCARGLCSHIYHNDIGLMKKVAKKGVEAAKAIGTRVRQSIHHKLGPKI